MKGKEKKIPLFIIIFTISINLLFFIPTAQANSQIVVSFVPSPNEPPTRPTNIYPSDGATDIEIPVTLQVFVYDESSSTVDVYFYNALVNASIGVDYNVSADWSTASVIWNGLAEGTSYSWYAVANDSEYENTSQTWTFTTESSYTPPPSPTYTYSGGGSEDNPPTISNIYHGPTKVTSNDLVYVYATVIDDYIVKSVTLYWNDGSDHSKSMILQDGNSYYAQIGPFPDGITVTYSIEATDYCGASHTIQSTKSFTVVGPIIETVIENISSGETKEIILEKSNGIGIDSIYFTPAIDLTNVKITIEKLADKPENITTAPTETEFIYTYLDIDLTADNEFMGEDEIESLIIIFKVNLTWMAENNMDKETIASMIYCVRHGDEWQNLTTTILFEDETYVYCKIEMNHTSIVVIVVDEVIEPLGPEEEKEQPPPLILLILLMAIIATLMPVFILKSKRRQIYYYMRNKLNNIHNIKLKVNELSSRLDNKNNKEIKKEKPEQSLRKRR